MSFKTKVILLKRVRAGDQDVLVKAYGYGGLLDILVRDGLLNSSRFFGLFEPFNLLELDLRQRGSIALPNDVIKVERLSYLSKDYRRYRWMCWVSLFVLKHIRFYDEKLFSLILKAMLTDPKGKEGLLRVKFKLNFLILSGLSPRFLKEDFGKGYLRVRLSDGGVVKDGELKVNSGVLRLLKRLRDKEKVKVREGTLYEAEKFLDLLIEYHTK